MVNPCVSRVRVFPFMAGRSESAGFSVTKFKCQVEMFNQLHLG